jgi:hypothetical protein
LIANISGVRNDVFGLYCLKFSVALGSPVTFSSFRIFSSSALPLFHASYSRNMHTANPSEVVAVDGKSDRQGEQLWTAEESPEE